MSNLLNIKDQNGNWIPIPVITNGIQSITQNQDYTLTITLNDGTTYTTTSIKGEDGQDYILTENDKQEIADLVDVPVEDVQVNGTSVVSNGVANISISEPEPEGMVVKTTLVSGNQYTIDSTYDTIKTTLSFGINVIVMAQDVPQPYVGNVQMDGVWYLAFGVSTTYNNYATLVGFLIPETYQNIAVWVDQSVHIPVLDDSDIDISIVWSSSKINDELSQKVDDIQINGTSIVTSGVANIPIGYAKTGLIRISGNSDVTGLYMNSSTGATVVHKADDNQVKAGTMIYRPITPSNQHQSVFYGLAKAAGDVTQSQSSNAVGTYTSEAIVAIQKMFGVYKAPWELINDYTITEDSETIEVITDLSGQPFELTESFIRVYFEPSLTGKNDYIKGNTYIRQTNNEIVWSGGFPTIRYMANGTITYSEYRQELIGDILRTDVRTGSGASNTQGVQSISADPVVHTSSIMGIRLRQYNDTSTLIPSGTRIQLYGRRK